MFLGTHGAQEASLFMFDQFVVVMQKRDHRRADL